MVLLRCPVSESSNSHYTDKVDMALTFTSFLPTSFPRITPRSVRLCYTEPAAAPRPERAQGIFTVLAPVYLESSNGARTMGI